jgi:zinc transport system substrate-binding protein
MWRTWILSLLFFSLIISSKGSAKDFSIVTTIFPLKEFAHAVGGERVNVNLLLPPGAEPHTWEPRPSDIIKLSHADIFIYTSAEMEPWIQRVLKSINNPKLIIIEASQGLPLLSIDNLPQPHDENFTKKNPSHGGVDPHFWLNFEYDQKVVDKIANALSKKDPEGAEYYRTNAEKYKKKLQDLDLKYKKELNNCKCREFIVGGHSAFSYMAKRYELKQISLYSINPNSEPTPKKMAEVIKLAKQYQVRAIYFEEMVSDKLAKVIAKEVGAKVLVLNPGANLKRKQIDSGVTFLSLMEKNLDNLKYGLICK